MNIPEYNRKAWDGLVEKNDPWTRPVDEQTIAVARAGSWNIVLTPFKPVPRSWFPASLCGKSGLVEPIHLITSRFHAKKSAFAQK